MFGEQSQDKHSVFLALLFRGQRAHPFWVLLKWASLSGPAFQTISFYVTVWRVGLHPVSMADFSGLGPDRS